MEALHIIIEKYSKEKELTRSEQLQGWLGTWCRTSKGMLGRSFGMVRMFPVAFKEPGLAKRKQTRVNCENSSHKVDAPGV